MKVNHCKAIEKDIIGESCAEEEGVVLGRDVVYESWECVLYKGWGQMQQSDGVGVGYFEVVCWYVDVYMYMWRWRNASGKEQKY